MPPSAGGVRAAWRATRETSVIAVGVLTERFLPLLRESRGHVVLIKSGSGHRAWSDASGYAASRFALTSDADGRRDAERSLGPVTSIHPWRVDTDMQRDLQERMGHAHMPEVHLSVGAAVAVARVAVDPPPGAVVKNLSVRPAAHACSDAFLCAGPR